MFNIILYILLGLFAGGLSGFIGIGGGVIIIPALIYLFGLSQHEAQGTTLALMVPPIGLLAALKYYQHGYVNLQIALFICVGFFLGAFFGAEIATHLSGNILKKLFGVFLLAVALKMILVK
jgi:uncharacterized membrane protein YfcA